MTLSDDALSSALCENIPRGFLDHQEKACGNQSVKSVLLVKREQHCYNSERTRRWGKQNDCGNYRKGDSQQERMEDTLL